MKIKFWEKRAEKVDPRFPGDPALADFYGLRGGVNATTAMRLTAVYAAVTIISETIAGLPLHLMRKSANDTRKPAINDPRYLLLNEIPNRYQTKFEFIECMIMTYLLHGRAVAQIVTDRAGKITDLMPLPPTVKAVKMPDGSLAYSIREKTGNERYFLADEVIDLRGPSLDGVECMSPIEQNDHALSLAMSADQYASDFFKNSSVVSGVLETDSKLSDKAYERLKKWWEKTKQSGGRHASPIFEEGVKWKNTVFNPKDTQLIETSKYSIADIARNYRIPL